MPAHRVPLSSGEGVKKSEEQKLVDGVRLKYRIEKHNELLKGLESASASSSPLLWRGAEKSEEQMLVDGVRLKYRIEKHNELLKGIENASASSSPLLRRGGRETGRTDASGWGEA